MSNGTDPPFRGMLVESAIAKAKVENKSAIEKGTNSSLDRMQAMVNATNNKGSLMQNTYNPNQDFKSTSGFNIKQTEQKFQDYRNLQKQVQERNTYGLVSTTRPGSDKYSDEAIAKRKQEEAKVKQDQINRSGLITEEKDAESQRQVNISKEQKEHKKYPHSKDAQDAKRNREEWVKKSDELYKQQARNKIADKIHTGLDMVGAAPGIGAASDLLNAHLYDLEGDTENRNIALGSAVPLAGLGVTMGKYSRKGYKAASKSGFFGLGKKSKQLKIDKQLRLKEDWSKINTEFDTRNKAAFLKNPNNKPTQNLLNPPSASGYNDPDYNLVNKLINEASDPNTARRLEGLGANPQGFKDHAQNQIRYYDNPDEGAYFKRNRHGQLSINTGSKKTALRGKDDYTVGAHELYGHGTANYISKTNPSKVNKYGETWVDQDFQQHVINNAPDSKFIKEHGYSENMDTDYLLNTDWGPQFGASGRKGGYGIGKGGGNRRSQESLPYLSEMRREMGPAIGKSYDSIFSVDDIKKFSLTKAGKKNRVLNTGIPIDNMMASFLDKAPMVGGVIAAGGAVGLSLNFGRNNKNKQ